MRGARGFKRAEGHKLNIEIGPWGQSEELVNEIREGISSTHWEEVAITGLRRCVSFGTASGAGRNQDSAWRGRRLILGGRWSKCARLER